MRCLVCCKLRKLGGPYVISGWKIEYKGSRSPAMSWSRPDHPNLVYIFYFRCERNVLNLTLMEECLFQSYLDKEISDLSVKVSLLDQKGLQFFSGGRCCNSQHSKSSPEIKQPKCPPAAPISRALPNSLLQVFAPLLEHLQATSRRFRPRVLCSPIYYFPCKWHGWDFWSDFHGK